jgi:glycine/D-amino acid oxidase-like deaminating enzyme
LSPFLFLLPRLVHPLSPRGKLVHWGREGLEATNNLVKQACNASNDKENAIVLRSELFRVATSPKQADQLQQTAKDVPDFCQWIAPEEMSQWLSMPSVEHSSFGGLRLYNGCQVIHLPSYLKGLWAACQKLSQVDSNVSAQWKLMSSSSIDDNNDRYDAIVWAAGAGLFQVDGNSSAGGDDELSLPVELVRGQSMEIRVNNSAENLPSQAGLLSGKYVCPLPEPNRVLVGATHEYGSVPMSEADVRQELRDRTKSFCPHVWDENTWVVERYTTGTRVQSQRGAHGRLPIIGELQRTPPAVVSCPLEKASDSSKSWIFTGLSSRGLLYHGVYGKLLAQAILDGSEDCLERQCVDFDWWRRGK